MSPAAPTQLCGGLFRAADKVAEGAFGAVFRGANILNGREVAIKLEFSDFDAEGSLANEYAMLSRLSLREQPQGFAEAFWFGRVEGHACLVMELLGQSLESTVSSQGGRLPAVAVAQAATQALMRVEYLHSKCIVHRDIKPENFMWGIKDRVHHLYLIDFGMSTEYWDRRHAKERRELWLVGTARYASINAHELRTQSRRDDLEALGHMFFWMLRGELPWSGLKAASDREKHRKIGEKKRATAPSELGEGHPQEFATYLESCRGLAWDERPDYELLQQLMQRVRKRSGDPADHRLPWLGQGLRASALAPIRPWSSLQQPDDNSSSDGGLWTCAPKISLGRPAGRRPSDRPGQRVMGIGFMRRRPATE